MSGLVFIMLLAFAAAPPDDPPVAVFAELDGVWEGTFVGYDAEGRELYRIAVRQTYRTVDAATQTVTIRDTMPDGTVVTGDGRNVARRREDGELELRCVVEKSNGESVEHQGRLGAGPAGEPQIVWSSASPGRLETFRETVRHDATGWTYEIDGVGRYGEDLVIMAGRYRKVAE